MENVKTEKERNETYGTEGKKVMHTSGGHELPPPSGQTWFSSQTLTRLSTSWT